MNRTTKRLVKKIMLSVARIAIDYLLNKYGYKNIDEVINHIREELKIKEIKNV